ncbi:hypothetical protein [Flavobacterium sp. GT3R68]|uniref:hypothetical protein n=1 Tax=Flavobacterium sp. GT3R68 TaxID=2594437 RepID=UPI000F877F8D|nr:hypothetical protein [Flavobacterium sp. GT3R68]RTY93894.1 hypothetical protein EKL32_13490 [Flavobacterium sp. GSN2]TRW93492.1 hypothetical protein FNW07_00895 [Flavobacterium sp. GT3R68]
MKKKLIIVNLSLMTAVLFAILFQSMHSYEHLAKQFTEKQCHHQYNSTKTEFTHHHTEFDHCFVCEFTLSSFIAPDTFCFKPTFAPSEIPYFLATPEIVIPFSGSRYTLRGPPHCIV